MSRSGYNDYDGEEYPAGLWRGAVERALGGRRGQAFLREMLAALDALSEKKLISHELEQDGCVCALGSVGKARKLDMSEIDPEDHDTVAAKFGIAHAMACEIMYTNDSGAYRGETPEERFIRMRKWIESEIRKEDEA